jgi:hypothetical protein
MARLIAEIRYTSSQSSGGGPKLHRAAQGDLSCPASSLRAPLPA